MDLQERIFIDTIFTCLDDKIKETIREYGNSAFNGLIAELMIVCCYKQPNGDPFKWSLVDYSWEDMNGFFEVKPVFFHDGYFIVRGGNYFRFLEAKGNGHLILYGSNKIDTRVVYIKLSSILTKEIKMLKIGKRKEILNKDWASHKLAFDRVFSTNNQNESCITYTRYTTLLKINADDRVNDLQKSPKSRLAIDTILKRINDYKECNRRFNSLFTYPSPITMMTPTKNGFKEQIYENFESEWKNGEYEHQVRKKYIKCSKVPTKSFSYWAYPLF